MGESNDPTLATLRADLERLGYVVVPHGAELCVRLPLLCSIRVREEGARLHFRAQFGPLGRTGGLLATSLASVIGVGATALATGSGVATGVAAFIGVVALAHDGCRFVLTEGCLTRLQQLLTLPRLPAVPRPAALQDPPPVGLMASVSTERRRP